MKRNLNTTRDALYNGNINKIGRNLSNFIKSKKADVKTRNASSQNNNIK